MSSKKLMTLMIGAILILDTDSFAVAANWVLCIDKIVLDWFGCIRFESIKRGIRQMITTVSTESINYMIQESNNCRHAGKETSDEHAKP